MKIKLPSLDKFIESHPIEIVFVILFLWTPIQPVKIFLPNLDTSWEVAVQLAFLDGLTFGRDIVFTYGPLGFLWSELPVDHQLWQWSFLFRFALHGLFLLSLYTLVKKLELHWIQAACLALVVLFTLEIQVEFKILLTAFFFLYTRLIEDSPPQRSTWRRYGVVAVLLGVGTFIKITVLITAGIFLVLFVLLLMTTREKVKYREVAWEGGTLWGAFFLTVLGVGALIGYSPGEVVQYYHHSLVHVAFGFNEAMSKSGQTWQLVVAAVVLLSTMGWMVYTMVVENRRATWFLIFLSGLLFTLFKYSFVRHDTYHVLLFFKICPLLFLVFTFLLVPRGPVQIDEGHPFWKVSQWKVEGKAAFLFAGGIALVMIPLASLFYVTPDQAAYRLNPKFNHYLEGIRLFADGDRFLERRERERAMIQQYFSFSDSVVEKLKSKTVDVYPHHIMLPWIYGWTWSPRYTLQSYKAYTGESNRRNRDHLVGPKGPHWILFHFKTMGNRYPLFEDSLSWPEILHRYHPVQKGAPGFWLLERKDEVQGPPPTELLGETTVRAGEPIPVPPYDKGTVFAHIEIESTGFGKLIQFLYKGTPPHLQFVLTDRRKTPPYRIQPATASQGLLVSHFVHKLTVIPFLVEGLYPRNVESIIIHLKGRGRYSPQFQVTFTGQPLTPEKPRHSLDLTALGNRRTHRAYRRFVTMGEETRVSILASAPGAPGGRIAFPNLAIKPGSRFLADLAIAGTVWKQENRKGVKFEVLAQVEGRKKKDLLFSHHLQPQVNPRHRNWFPVDVDLSRYAGKKITLTLVTTSVGNDLPGIGNGIWGTPRITWKKK